LSDFEKGSSPTDDALSAFTSQANDALKDNGETVQSYVGKPPLTPPLEHAYPMSHQHAALLPPLNNQPLPPLNHNKLIAAADTNRYTGSEANTFASQGRKTKMMFLYMCISISVYWENHWLLVKCCSGRVIQVGAKNKGQNLTTSCNMMNKP